MKLARWAGRTLALCAVLTALRMDPAHAAEPNVVVTIKPIHSLVSAIMKGVATPRLLLDGAASPHTYALKPSEARLLNAADIVVRVSDGLETFLVKPLAALPKRVEVVSLDKLSGLTLHALREGGNFKSEGGGHHDHHHHEKGGHGGTDPHIWLDPRNARVIVDGVTARLVQLAPEQKAVLEDNARGLQARLAALERTLEGELRPLAKARFIVFHDAYQYFEKRFGLHAAGSVTVNPDVPPSAKRLTKLRQRLKSLDAACVFAEPQFPPRIIDSIIEGTGARRGVLDPLGAALPKGEAHYGELLTGLARDLKACLEGRA